MPKLGLHSGGGLFNFSDMSNPTESIFNTEFVTIPMAEVSHVKRLKDTNCAFNRIRVIFKHSKLNNKTNQYEPNILLEDISGSNSFMKAWCRYRSELEGV